MVCSETQVKEVVLTLEEGERYEYKREKERGRERAERKTLKNRHDLFLNADRQKNDGGRGGVSNTTNQIKPCFPPAVEFAAMISYSTLIINK